MERVFALFGVSVCVRVCVYNYIQLVRMCERVCVYYYRQLVRIFVNAMCGDASYPHWVQLANLTTHFGSELQTQHNNACGCVSLERRHLPKTHHHPTQEGASDVSASTCIIYFSASSHWHTLTHTRTISQDVDGTAKSTASTEAAAAGAAGAF